MKFNDLKINTTRAFYSVGFKFKKHSPEILVVAGVVGTVVGAVMACRATTKVTGIIETAKNEIDTIHACSNDPALAEQYSQEDAKKDLTIVYAKTGVNVVKLYAPSVAVGAVSIAGILYGHRILHKRNLALASAYTAVHNGFKQYRGRVVERFGEKLDKELLYNIKAKQVEETVVNEDGTETTVTKTIEVADPVAAMSPYTFCFDESASGWVRDAERNKFFLLRQQDYANELLKSKGRVTLNEVLAMVGLPECRMGQAVGWLLNGDGDGYIDFGLLDIHNEANRAFMNGLEKSIWLNFNVDGEILHSYTR